MLSTIVFENQEFSGCNFSCILKCFRIGWGLGGWGHLLYGGSFGVSSSVRLPVASVVLVVAEGARTDSIKPEDFFTVGRSVSRLSDI
jgi:hypothetical protein